MCISVYTTDIARFVSAYLQHHSDVEISTINIAHTFLQALCEKVGPLLINVTLDTPKKLLCSIWLLANQESFRGVADRFDMSKGTLHYIFSDICKVLCTLRNEYIRWPREEEFASLANGFQYKTGFPGVIGAIDGTHIPIPAPTLHRNSYINRKGHASIQLQAVCTSQMMFLDVYTGWPGSVHDARVFRNCPLYGHLQDAMRSDYHLLGDSAYPLSTSLITPYRDNGHLSRRQKIFNTLHSSTRVVIERAFGLLKGKWRRLKYLPMEDLEKVPVVITAACVLHNFLLREEGHQMEDCEEVDGNDDNDCQAGHPENTSGQRKRDDIASFLVEGD